MNVDMSHETVTKRLEVMNELWIETVKLIRSKDIHAQTTMRIVNDQYERGELDIAENHTKK